MFCLPHAGGQTEPSPRLPAGQQHRGAAVETCRQLLRVPGRWDHPSGNGGTLKQELNPKSHTAAQPTGRMLQVRSTAAAGGEDKWEINKGKRQEQE